MATIQPDLEWYTGISAAKNLSPRCPFASVHRCPRYYESLSLFGTNRVATSIDPAEDEPLLEKWQRSDLWPVTREQAVQVMGAPDDPSHFFNFCPEVSFDRFGWFASHLSYYSDEIDTDMAHRNLADEGAAPHDWRWTWSHVKELHYADCRLYSPLLVGVNDIRTRTPMGFNP